MRRYRTFGVMTVFTGLILPQFALGQDAAIRWTVTHPLRTDDP